MLQDLLKNYQLQYPAERIIVDKMREFLNEHKENLNSFDLDLLRL